MSQPSECGLCGRDHPTEQCSSPGRLAGYKHDAKKSGPFPRRTFKAMESIAKARDLFERMGPTEAPTAPPPTRTRPSTRPDVQPARPVPAQPMRHPNPYKRPIHPGTEPGPMPRPKACGRMELKAKNVILGR